MSPPTYVYVLELENDRYYVGVSDHPSARFREHVEGRGAAWTQRHRPRRIVETEAFATKSAALERESVVTRRLMSRHGVDFVRGGCYVAIELAREERVVLDVELAHQAGRCLRCGRASHFQKDCFATTHVNGYALSSREGANSPNRRAGGCETCGRRSHAAVNCFARFSIDGRRLEPASRRRLDFDACRRMDSDSTDDSGNETQYESACESEFDSE